MMRLVYVHRQRSKSTFHEERGIMKTVHIAGFDLEHPVVMNAGGTCKSMAAVKTIAPHASAVVHGSTTMKPRSRNTGTIYWHTGVFSLNSIGMENEGMDVCVEQLPEMVAIAHNYGKPLIENVAGSTPLEYAELTYRAFNKYADGVEQNWGCPNIWDGGTQHEIFSYDPELAEETLARTKSLVGLGLWLAVKVSPMHPSLILRMARIITNSEIVKAVVAVNTFPNALMFDTSGDPVITPGGGLGGFAGPAYLPIALGQVRQWRQALPAHISVIGVGGITSSADMLSHFYAGAVAVQVNTLLREYEDPEILSYIRGV